MSSEMLEFLGEQSFPLPVATARVAKRPIASRLVLPESTAALPRIATNTVIFALFFEN